MTLRATRRGALVFGAVLLAMFLVRPGVARLKHRIESSLGDALGRRVEIGSVHLRVLPQPGFDLDNVVVQDDPQFSAEPMLTAQQVTTNVRVMALFRGRLELSSLSLSDPSVNLVRNQAGRWNLEDLLERRAKTATAPTSQGSSKTRPAFPYLEASAGRINFKFNLEKKPVALLEADFALWQDSENSWAMRLKAQPTRTDMSLSDTGSLRVNGTWQRAGSLHETPLHLQAQWEQAQLGQMTKLVWGQDKGWRGGVTIIADIAGSPGALLVKTQTTVNDFRRYDISSLQNLRLALSCQGTYSTADSSVRELFCQVPMAAGTLTVAGEVGWGTTARYDLKIAAEGIPAQGLAVLAQHAKQDLLPDLRAVGVFDGEFEAKKEAGNGNATFLGRGALQGLQLSSKVEDATFDFGDVAVTSGRAAKNVAGLGKLEPGGINLQVGPASVELGTVPSAAQGRVSRTGYDFRLRGGVEISRTLKLARMLGVTRWKPAAEGTARVDLGINGTWAGWAHPAVSGTAIISGVTARVAGMRSPLKVNAADLSFLGDSVQVQKLQVGLGGMHWTGTATVPRHCEKSDGCESRFDLAVDQIALEDVRGLFGEQAGKRPWYQWPAVGSPAASNPLLALRAEGQIQARVVKAGNVVATNCAANFQASNGKIQLRNLRGKLLGGSHLGEWSLDGTKEPAKYSGRGKFSDISLSTLAGLWREEWIAGKASGDYQFTATGANAAEAWKKAAGTLQFVMSDGTFPQVKLEGAPLKVGKFVGTLQRKEGEFVLERGKLVGATGIYAVTGTASDQGALKMRLQSDGAPVVVVQGTVTHPTLQTMPAAK